MASGAEQTGYLTFYLFSFADVASGAEQAGSRLPALPLRGEVPERDDPVWRGAGGPDPQRALEVPLW